jgi:hypothetical protein
VDSGAVTCAAAASGNEYCRWRSPSEYRGTFHRPLGSTLEQIYTMSGVQLQLKQRQVAGQIDFIP